MKNFGEKAIKNLSEIVGGQNLDHIYLTGGISGVRDGIKGNTTIAFDIHKSI